MKKHKEFIAIALIVQWQITAGQIIINSTDMPVVGDSIHTATDTAAVGFTIGNAGVNQTWDFSAAAPDLNNITYVQNPSSTPYPTDFPTANLALTNNFSDYVFVKLNTQAYAPQGLVGDLLRVGLPLVVQLNPPYDLYRFPTQYNNRFSGNYGFVKTIPPSQLPAALLQQIQQLLPNGATLLNIRGTYTSTFTDTIDGWGKTITPVCSYNSLRQKRVENIHLLIEAQINYFFTFWTTALDTTFTTRSYNWLAEETKLPVVTVGFDSVGNINSVTYSLIPPTLNADFNVNKTLACPGEAVNFTDLSSGCPDSWQWTFSGGNPSSSSAKNPTNITYNSPGIYPVVLQVNKAGKTDTETKVGYITVGNPLAEAGPDDTICSGQTGSLMASGGISYLWNNGTTGSTLSASPASSTVYSVTVTDNNGCTASDTAAIIVLPLPNADAGVNDTICKGETGILTASGGVSYAWNTGTTAQILTVVPGSTSFYSVTVTDSHGCSAFDNASIVVNPIPTKELFDLNICFGSTTILDAGNAGSMYQWSTGETLQTLAVSSGGIYSVTVTNIHGCTNSDSAQVTVGTNLTINLSDQFICQGDTVTLNAGNPGTTHFWSTGDSAQTIQVTATGLYAVTVTDIVGCTGEDSSMVVVNPLPPADAGDNDTICLGEAANLQATGGIAYLWSTGDTASSVVVNPVTTTVFKVTVVDVNGCSAIDSSYAMVNPLPTAYAGEDDSICKGEELDITATGGNSFIWNTGDSMATIHISPLVDQVYTVTVMDANGCQAQDSISIMVFDLPVVFISGIDSAYCPYHAEVALSGMPSGGWFSGEGILDTTFYPSNVPAGTIVVKYEYTDEHNCTDSLLKTVIIYPEINATFTDLDSHYCENAAFITLSGSPAGGFFSGPGVTANSFDPSIPGAGGPYQLIYQFYNATGCVFSDTGMVIVDTLPELSILGLDSVYCIDDGPDSLTGLPQGGTFMGAGMTGNIFHPDMVLMPETYIITYSYVDGNGCTNLEKANVKVEECVGLPGYYFSDDIAVYPNPARGKIFIKIAGNTDVFGWVLFDVTGKKLFETEQTNVSGPLEFSTENLPSGIYYLQVKNGEKTGVRKVVVQK